MNEPLTDVRQISHIAYGFMASKALFAALNVELFGHLDKGARDIEALAGATGMTPHGLETLLASLLSLGLLVRDGDDYANAPATASYLVPGAKAYFGDYYRFQIDRQVYPNFIHLDAGLAGNEEGLAHDSFSGWVEDAQMAADFSRAQHAGSLGPALMMSDRIDLSGRRRLLDVAGGTGAYSITFCRRQAELVATIIDFPSVIEVAKGYVTAAGLEDRITLQAGDALAEEWPGNQDVVLMSYFLSAVGGGDIETLLGRAWQALAPGGRLIVHDFMLDDDRAGPAQAAAWFLVYLPLRTDAVSFSAAELEPLIAGHGFEGIQDQVMIPEITKVITAEKPGTG
ncbi:MAG TPA: methyltransferase [Alphaproteobacteria bacterium]|jgi:ubiquinone/menaquinone biosynthesis C-methylase UbiE|nr:methyltransferase [Alphaproteobacteria bacterium]HJM50701.1 methyltransferase [Alphaproteobacteria bacterium]